MHPALTLAGKDLRQRLRDRSAVMLAIVVPLALAAIFSVLFGPSSTPRAFEYGVVDADGSAMTRGFTAEVLGALEDAGVAEVVALEDAAGLFAGVPDLHSEDAHLPGTVQLWPHRQATDAMFFALIRRLPAR